MRFPDVTELGAVKIEGRRFMTYLIADDWEPGLSGHDSEHATGGCSCPCYPPLHLIEDTASLARPTTADREKAG